MEWLLIAAIGTGVFAVLGGICTVVYNRLSLRRDLCLESRRQLVRCLDDRMAIIDALSLAELTPSSAPEIGRLLVRIRSAGDLPARSVHEAELSRLLAEAGLLDPELHAEDTGLLQRLQDLQRSATALVRLHNRHVRSYASLRGAPLALPLRNRFPLLEALSWPVPDDAVRVEEGEAA